jgi:hypothetical protein
MTDRETVPGKKKRLGPLGYLRALVIARTAAVSWPEAKEMARKNELDPAGPTDIPTDSERRRQGGDGP